MIRKCIWSQYSLKAPARKPETKQEVRPQPTAALSEKPRPCLGGGGEILPSVRPALMVRY